MKKYFIVVMMVGAVLLGLSSCEDKLDTFPTSSVGGPTIFNDVDGAMVALNGVYRIMYTSGWQTTGNHHQNFGVKSEVMVADLMGEDFVQMSMGSGWFWFDYTYSVRTRYTSSTWRSYGTWNYYYTIISNVNSIIANAEVIKGDPEEINSVIGQAYALRAMSYFELAQFFQQTLIGNEDKPGVPLYTEPTTPETEGKGRGTLQEAYDLINADISKAVELLEDAPERIHMSHINYEVANVFAARIYSVQQRWTDVKQAALNALGGSVDASDVASNESLVKGFNTLGDISTVLWGAEVIEDQAGVYASFFSHMDAREEVDRYGATSHKALSSFLYTQMGDEDVRQNWWKSTDDADDPLGQVKFMYRSPGVEAADYIYIRAEEMVLSLAEAQVMLDEYPEAKNTLKLLGEARDPNYQTRLNGLLDSKELTKTGVNSSQSAVVPVTLLDEVIMQRRIELWGEFGRLFDVQRLGLGITRKFANTNHPDKAWDNSTNMNFAPGSKEFIMTIPQAEFDGNVNLSGDDQNPL